MYVLPNTSAMSRVWYKGKFLVELNKFELRVSLLLD